jgi:hypothetical protein
MKPSSTGMVSAPYVVYPLLLRLRLNRLILLRLD